MGVPGFIPGVLDFSLWKTKESLQRKVRMYIKINMLCSDITHREEENDRLTEGR